MVYLHYELLRLNVNYWLVNGVQQSDDFQGNNRPFFLTDSADVLKREQNTATLGLVWWFGRKQGAW
jgi:hypothetical protein